MDNPNRILRTALQDVEVTFLSHLNENRENNTAQLPTKKQTPFVLPMQSIRKKATSAAGITTITLASKGVSVSKDLRNKPSLASDMTHLETSEKVQASELEKSKPEEEGACELTAAAALTSLVSSATEPTKDAEEHDDDEEEADDGEDNASDTDFNIPQRYTRSGRKRAVSFPLKVRCLLDLNVLNSENHHHPQYNLLFPLFS